MPRYFFHVSSGSGKIPDTQGYEFTCAERACLYAHRIAREAQTYLDAEDGRWMIRITSEEDDLEIIVLFPAPVSSNAQNDPAHAKIVAEGSAAK